VYEPQPPPEAVFQRGVFTRAQAYAAGSSVRQVRRWLEVGHWKVVAGAAVGPASLSVGPEQLGWAAVLTWPGAVVSHACAGALHGFPVPTPRTGTAIVSPERGLTARGLRGFRVPLSADDVVLRAGLPLTDRRRTAVDLLATLGWDECRDLSAWLVTRRVISPEGLRRAVTMWSGRPGVQQLRRLAKISSRGSLSAGEDLLHDVLRHMGLSGWTANVPIMVGGQVIAVVDVLFETPRIVIQVDGWHAHGTRASFQRDRTQQNLLVAAGYTVLRFTWHDLTKGRREVARVISTALSERAS
jgi:very-short-patch-repair endonuclease